MTELVKPLYSGDLIIDEIENLQPFIVYMLEYCGGEIGHRAILLLNKLTLEYRQKDWKHLLDNCNYNAALGKATVVDFFLLFTSVREKSFFEFLGVSENSLRKLNNPIYGICYNDLPPILQNKSENIYQVMRLDEEIKTRFINLSAVPQ